MIKREPITCKPTQFACDFEKLMTCLYYCIKPNPFSVFAFALRSVFATKSKDTWLEYKPDHTVCSSALSNYLTPLLLAKAYVSFLSDFLCPAWAHILCVSSLHSFCACDCLLYANCLGFNGISHTCQKLSQLRVLCPLFLCLDYYFLAITEILSLMCIRSLRQ